MPDNDSIATTDEPRTIFVVEDDNSLALLLRFLIEREGFRVEHASDGRVAEEKIKQLPPPALALLDIMLPYADGYDLLKCIRSHDRWKDVPVLMLTSKGSEGAIARALDNGADDYVVKPFQADELKARIRRLAKGRR